MPPHVGRPIDLMRSIKAPAKRLSKETYQEFDLSHAGLGSSWFINWGPEGPPTALICEPIGVSRHRSRPSMTMLMLVPPAGVGTPCTLYGQSADWGHVAAAHFTAEGIYLYDSSGYLIQASPEAQERDEFGDAPWVMSRWLMARTDMVAHLAERFGVTLPDGDAKWRWIGGAREARPTYCSEPAVLANGREVLLPPAPDGRPLLQQGVSTIEGHGGNRRAVNLPARHGDSWPMENGEWCVLVSGAALSDEDFATVQRTVSMAGGRAWSPRDLPPQSIYDMGHRVLGRANWLIVHEAQVPRSVQMYVGPYISR